MLTRNTGILAAYIVGAIVEYEYIPFIFIIVPVVYFFLFSMLPNTPQYYLGKKNTEVSVLDPRQKKTTIDSFFNANNNQLESLPVQTKIRKL